MQPYPPAKMQCSKCGNTDFWITRGGDGRFIKPEPPPPECCGQVMDDYEYPIRTAPTLMDDIKPFMSPMGGEMITSRSQKRAMMKKHDLVEVGNEKMPERKKEDNSLERKRDIAAAIDQLGG